MPKSSANSLERFIEEFLLSHANLNTRQSYKSDLRALDLWFRPWDGCEDSLAVIKFVRKLERDGLGAATIRGRVIRLRKLYDFMRHKGVRRDNPVSIDIAPKVKDKRQPRSPTMDELRSLFAVISELGKEGLRDQLIVAFLYYEALRVHELCSLNLGSFEEVGGRIVCDLKGKGGRLDRVKLFPQTEKLLRRYLRSLRGAKAATPLFCSMRKSGQRLSTRAVRKRIDGYFEQAGIRKGLSCHSLRHAHATILAARGYPVTGVQKRLRHSSPLTSLKYYVHDEESAYLPHAKRPEQLIELEF